MDVVPFFGDSFTVYFPIFIAVFCVGTFFNVYGRLMRMLGVTRFEYRANFSDENVYEGVALIRKEKRKRGIPTDRAPSKVVRRKEDRQETLLDDNL